MPHFSKQVTLSELEASARKLQHPSVPGPFGISHDLSWNRGCKPCLFACWLVYEPHAERCDFAANATSKLGCNSMPSIAKALHSKRRSQKPQVIQSAAQSSCRVSAAALPQSPLSSFDPAVRSESAVDRTHSKTPETASSDDEQPDVDTQQAYAQLVARLKKRSSAAQASSSKRRKLLGLSQAPAQLNGNSSLEQGSKASAGTDTRPLAIDSSPVETETSTPAQQEFGPGWHLNRWGTLEDELCRNSQSALGSTQIKQ